MKAVLTASVLIAAAGVANGQVIISSSSFEGGDAAGWAGDGDWELGVPSGFAGAPFGGPEPVGGNTGDWAWGTVIGGAHNPSTISSLSQTFDLSGIVDSELSFAEYSESGGNTFDTAEVIVNGVQLYLSDGNSGLAWRDVVLDLSAFDGQSEVDVSFVFSTTGVVERVGWYIDDVTVSGIPTPGAAGLLGVAGLAATRRRR